MEMIKTNNELKQYLLGNTSKKTAKEIDLEVISNEAFEENLLIAEGDLIEDFLEGTLLDDEIVLFNQNFMISKDRFEQVKTIAQLKHYSKNFPIDDDDGFHEPVKESNFFLNLKHIFTRKTSIAFGSLLLFGLIGSLIWAVYFNNSNEFRVLEKEFAQINAGEFNNKANFNDLSHLILIDGKTRGDGKSKELLMKDLTDRVFFNIAIRATSIENETYKIELVNNKEIRFTQNNIRPFKNEFGDELRFLLPKDVFKKGQYQIKVSSNSVDKNKITYSFAVK